MKKWMYLIFPGAMLGVFLVFFFSHQKEADEREHNRTVELQAKLDKEKKDKDIAEMQLRKEAAEKQAQREKDEADKERNRREKQAAEDKKVTDAIAEFQGKANASQKEINARELELNQLHRDKEKVGLDTFELFKQVEALKVDRRTAELKEQRMTEMIARKAAESAMAKMPPPPPPPPTKP